MIDVALAGKGQSSRARWLVSQKILNVEELETLPVGIKPRTSHFRSPGGKRETERERKEEQALDDIFLERARTDHRQTAQQRATRATSERRAGGAHMGFTERVDTILN